MKCAVEGCDNIASKDCGFQQVGTVGEMEIKTSGLLCKACFNQAMNGERKEKQEYCAGCGIAFWKRITGEPVLTHTLNGKKYCNACFKKQEAKKEEEPLNWAYQCADCNKKLGMMEAWKHYNKRTNKIEAYCQACHEKYKEQQANKAKTCSTCGADAFNDLEKCEFCGKLFCIGCQANHWQQVHKKCYFCGANFFASLDGTNYCRSCWEEHKEKEKQKEEEHWNQRQQQKEKCADCGKEFSKLFSKPYCIECFQRRQNQQKDQTPKGFWEELFGNQTYNTRREYSFSADQMEEDIARMRNFFGGNAHFYSGSTAGQQQQTKTSGSSTYIPTEVKEAFKKCWGLSR